MSHKTSGLTSDHFPNIFKLAEFRHVRAGGHMKQYFFKRGGAGKLDTTVAGEADLIKGAEIV